MVSDIVDQAYLSAVDGDAAMRGRAIAPGCDGLKAIGIYDLEVLDSQVGYGIDLLCDSLDDLLGAHLLSPRAALGEYAVDLGSFTALLGGETDVATAQG